LYNEKKNLENEHVCAKEYHHFFKKCCICGMQELLAFYKIVSVSFLPEENNILLWRNLVVRDTILPF